MNMLSNHPPRGRVAVFVDGDNVAAKSSGAISTIAEEYGSTLSKVVYTNNPSNRGWDECPGYRVILAKVGIKTVTDTLLCIDVMEAALLRQYDTFVIATSDADFTPLVERLRSYDICVVGIADNVASRHLRASFERFVHLTSPCAVESPKARLTFDAACRETVGPGWASLSAFAKLLHDRHGYVKKDSGHQSWPRYFGTKAEEFEMRGCLAKQEVRARISVS